MIDAEGVARRGNRITRSGFSLVELVIVIVILAILAAIAVPRISRGSVGANEAALLGSLRTLRTAIEMYAAEHMGTYPGVRGDGVHAMYNGQSFENQLTGFTDIKGVVADTRSSTYLFGPYLVKGLPPLPVGTCAGSTAVMFDDRNSTPISEDSTGIGWLFNPDTGAIVANSSSLDSTGQKRYDQY